MDAKTCLEKMKLVGVLSFATVDLHGAPQVRCISAIHFEEDGFAFFTARGKDFCRQLLADGRVQVLAYTRFKEMIRLSGRAVPLPQDRQAAMIDTIFAEQPYLANVYPGDTRRAGMVFAVKDAAIEYFALGVRPIFRESYMLGAAAMPEKGYIIGEGCIGCGKCLQHCPQQCITPGRPYKIEPAHCLHCGNCYENCPVQAVERRGTP